MTSNDMLVEIAGIDLVYRSAVISDTDPKALRILKAGGFKNLDQKTVIQVLPSGDLEERLPDEVCELSTEKPNHFIIGDADRLFRIVLEGRFLVRSQVNISDEVLSVLGISKKTPQYSSVETNKKMNQ